MATLGIRIKRTGKGGLRYIVRYRLGGRETPLVHAGTFKTMEEAIVRRAFVAGEIAAGRDPMKVLRAQKGEQHDHASRTGHRRND